MTNATGNLVAAALVERYSAEWQGATRHAFLQAVADGSLPGEAFGVWLAQDYLFVADLLVFQAHVLTRAPRSAQSVLAAGLVALEAELSWFEGHAARFGLALDVARKPTTAHYQALLEALRAAPYPAAITGLWAIERAYLDAWLGARPGGNAYGEFVEHWTVPAFADYVASLERASDQALSGSTSEICAEAGNAFVEVARIERQFWEMAWSGRAA
jgi:thiaminase/transcriptional activator TenA